jgi:predicted kinase
VADFLVLVNGLPGSGKTTLSRRIAKALAVPVVAKDALKEALAEAVPAACPDGLGAIAMDAAWGLAAEIPGTVVVESWWFRPRDLGFVATGLERCGNPPLVEVWCDVPAEIARARVAARQRHRVHEDSQRLAECWADWAARAEPLNLGPVLRVDTSVGVEVEAVVRGLALRQ